MGARVCAITEAFFAPILTLTGIVLIWLATTGCSTVPVTGRQQVNFIPADQEMKLGLDEFSKMKSNTPINRDTQVNALVQRVGRRIAAVADLPNAQWEFVVFQSPEANAFCLPGGKVGIYTGILPITKTEAGLAAVIGHEIAHAVARHGAERMTQALGLQLGGELAASALSITNARTQQIFATAYGLGTQVGLALPHSRMQESEADQIGLIYMARAGYQPEEAVAFWERFAEFNRRAGNNTPLLLRTHPLDATRIQQLKDALPRARQEYRAPGK
jgi:metalloendopeptidase OMA1, mitochondrial